MCLYAYGYFPFCRLFTTFYFCGCQLQPFEEKSNSIWTENEPKKNEPIHHVFCVRLCVETTEWKWLRNKTARPKWISWALSNGITSVLIPTHSLSLFLFWVLQLECELLWVLFLLFIHPTSTCSIKCRLKRSKTINLVAQCESFNYFPLETIAIIHFQMSLWFSYFRIWNWTVFCDSFALFIPCPLFHFLFTLNVTNLWTSWENFYDER